ncbi:MAG: TetR/AcrR family transcriptional regulator [Polyangiaceae bacterium]
MNEISERVRLKTRAQQKSETRARILDVARAHFERDGFEGANVRAIAAEAGVAAGTVLLHFSDKRDLLHAALFDDLAAVIAAAIEPPAHPRAKHPRTGQALATELVALAEPFFAYYRARPKLSRTLLAEALFAESPWRERFVEQVARVHAYVASRTQAAIERGELPQGTRADVLGASFFSFYYFALLGWVQGALPDPASLFSVLLHTHLGALARAPQRPKKPGGTRP